MRLRSFFALALVSAGPFQSQALADGSIAVARSKDDLRFNMGVSYNFAGRAAADAEALRQCETAEKAVPAADRGICTIIATYDNMCMALARDTGPGGTAWGWGSDHAQLDAEARAVQECRANAGDRADQCEVTLRNCDGSADDSS